MCIKFEQNCLMYHRLMASESGAVFFDPPCMTSFYDKFYESTHCTQKYRDFLYQGRGVSSKNFGEGAKIFFTLSLKKDHVFSLPRYGKIVLTVFWKNSSVWEKFFLKMFWKIFGRFFEKFLPKNAKIYLIRLLVKFLSFFISGGGNAPPPPPPKPKPVWTGECTIAIAPSRSAPVSYYGTHSIWSTYGWYKTRTFRDFSAIISGIDRNRSKISKTGTGCRSRFTGIQNFYRNQNEFDPSNPQ